MTVDIDEKVLAAFQIEHKEQLEGIRGLLSRLESEKTPECVDEAFRLAHSLKGGARVCDLRPAESLAHGMENLFEQVRRGTLRLDKDVVNTINVVLDAIEDWMAALDRDEDPADPREALTAVERLIEADAQDAGPSQVADDDLAQRLVKAFCRECPQYLAGLRQFAAAWDDEASEASADGLNEAYRLAHNLRGSAHAADIASIAVAGEALESLVAGFRDRAAVPDAAARETMRRYLDAVDCELDRLADAGAAAGRRRPDAGACDSTNDGPPEAAMPAAGPRNVDTVRISTESLDRLLRSSRQLVTENVRQEQMSRELEEIRRQVNQMAREREAIRRVDAASWHRLTAMPEFHRLASYFESVDRGVQSLARGTRRLCTVQKRNAWLLHSRGRQIQQDVRDARMVPAEAVYQSLRKLVRDLAKEEGKQIELRVAGFDVRADRMVFQALKDPLIHMLRNCIVHGVESPAERADAGKSATCRMDLRIETVGNRLTVEVDDDGRGIDRELVGQRAVERGLISRADLAERTAEEIESLIFQPGFSTSQQVTEIAGRGMGLSVVKDTVTRLQGDVHVLQNEPAGTKFRISVPLCVSTHRLLLVSADDQTFAIPVPAIERLLRVKAGDVETLEGAPVVTFRDQLVPLISLAGALGLPNARLKVTGDALQVAIVKSGARRVAVSVDAFLAERDLLIQDLDEPAASEAYLGAIVLDDGNAALVLNPGTLFQGARTAKESLDLEQTRPPAEKRTPRVLVVDDSFTTRTLEKSILEANGYEVGVAVDGVEGLSRLKSAHYDLVISDVEMPRMDGFAMLAEIKQDKRLSSIPVIIVTSRARREDQEKGLDLGAEAYIVKQKFDHQSLLSTIRQIVDV